MKEELLTETTLDTKQASSAVETFVIRKYKDGEPCELHCERHVTHPCERCGRVMAKGDVEFREFNV